MESLCGLRERDWNDGARYIEGLKQGILANVKVCETIQEAHREAICIDKLRLKKESPKKEQERILLSHILLEMIILHSPYADFSPPMRRKKNSRDRLRNSEHG